MPSTGGPVSVAAMVLAGGHGKRMGNVLKTLLPAGGVALLSRVLTALSPADQIVVVGPSELDGYLTPGAVRTREQPPGGGPVAAIAAGFALCAPHGQIVVVAGDLPFLTWPAITLLAQAQAGCAVYVDGEGRRQPMVAVWQATALAAALDGIPRENASMKALLAAADVAEVAWPGAGSNRPEPWYDCDTPEQLRHAEELL